MTNLRAMTMLRKAERPPGPRRGPGLARGSRSALARTAAAWLTLALGAALAGCSQQAAASSPRMELATAFVGQPQGSSPTDAYLVIRNNGATDQLISARTSVGGSVSLHGPAGSAADTMRAVRAITIPGHSMVRLDPNGYHLVITGARPMKSGTDITLTLVFAHAGTFQVAAQVTNPQTGGSSYLLN